MPDCLIRPCPDRTTANGRAAPDPHRHARFLGELARLRRESEKSGYSPYAALLLDQALLLYSCEYEQGHPPQERGRD